MARKGTKAGLTPKQAAYLAAYAETGNLRAASRIAGVHRSMHYDWLEQPEYAERFAEAHEDAIDTLESEARRRAVEGVEEPVFHKGEPVGAVRKYSDALLIFLLKGSRPEKYRERFDHQHAGRDGKAIPVALSVQDVMNELDRRATD